MIGEEISNDNIEKIYYNDISSNGNYNDIIIIQKPINMNEELNKLYNLDNYNYRPRTPNITESNKQIDNVQIKEKKNIEKNILRNRDNNNILNDQNVNILNYNFNQKNINLNPKVIIQKITNKENTPKNFQSYENFIKENQNELINNKIKEQQKQKGNYQYIIKNVKKVKQPLKTENNEFNDLLKQFKKNEEKVNVNILREGKRFINENKKYNYDKIAQKINPEKIPIPKNEKLLNESKIRVNGNKELEKEENNNVEDITKYIIPTKLEYNIYENMGNNNINKKNISSIENKLEINEKGQNEVNYNLRQNINFINYNNNNAKNKIIDNQNQINFNEPKLKIFDTINNQNINQQPTANLHINNQKINQAQEQYQFNNKDIKNEENPPPNNMLNSGLQQHLTVIRKLPPKTIDNNILKSNKNLPNQHQYLNNYSKNYDSYPNQRLENISQEDKSSKEYIFQNNKNKNNVNSGYARIVDDEPRNSDDIIIQQSKIQKINILQHQNQNIVRNMNAFRPNLVINTGEIQNINNGQIQRQFYNYTDPNIINNSYNCTNIPKLNKKNSHNNIQKQNLEINERQNAIDNYNNNIKSANNIIYPQNKTLVINQAQFQQIPNKKIVGDFVIKDGKAYYLNYNSNQNANENNINNNINIQNNCSQQPNIHIRNPNKIPNLKNNQHPIQNNAINNIPKPINNKIGIPKPPRPNINRQAQIRNIIKKKKLSRVDRILKAKDSKVHKPAFQHRVERNRPVYAIPPSKKRSISQGKPFNLINKYYNDNYILEDDEEEEDKSEETYNIQIIKNNNDIDENEN